MKSKTVKIFNSSEYGVRSKSSKSETERMRLINLFIGKNKRVLDVGCEDGEIAQMLLQNNNQVEGIEISHPAAGRARKLGFQVYEMDLESVWPRSFFHKYDVVFAGEVIEHIFDTDKFLENIRNVLKVGGELIITTPNLASFGRRLLLLFGKNPLIEVGISNTNAGHIRYFTFSSIEALLLKHSFQIMEQTSTIINFDINGKFSSQRLCSVFFRFGSTIIIKAKKN
jgi:2-polyprenyl-3-methyl-5-hydroxy-6-metoxy-1,4-benzoquinol methylase